MHNISALPQIKWDYHSPHLPGGGNDRTGAPADEGINGEKTGWLSRRPSYPVFATIVGSSLSYPIFATIVGKDEVNLLSRTAWAVHAGPSFLCVFFLFAHFFSPFLEPCHLILGTFLYVKDNPSYLQK